MSGSVNNSGPPHDGREIPSRDGAPGGRIPPPAFPPGRRRIQLRQTLEGPGAGQGDVEAAFISPDDPIPRRAAGLEGAFISPDDPIPHRTASSGGAGQEGRAARRSRPLQGGASGPGADVDEVVVTGIGSDAHLDPVELAQRGDPHVGEVANAVTKLAAALRHRGESGLRTTPEMTRFEAQLRAYCVGYLAGRRAEDAED